MRTIPDKEREEIREIYRAKGFSPEEVEMITNKITSNDKVWLDTMLTEELRVFPEARAGIVRGAAVTWISYFLSGFVPLIPYFVLPVNQGFIVSILLASLVLFCVGGAKSFFTRKNFVWSGVEMALIGMGAAGLSFGVGTLINSIFHVTTLAH
jgi:flavin reductase (DIM6/NTAB) family NADH-FMN oxidoreductase RutF